MDGHWFNVLMLYTVFAAFLNWYKAFPQFKRAGGREVPRALSLYVNNITS